MEQSLRARGVVCDSYLFLEYVLGTDHAVRYEPDWEQFEKMVPPGSFALLLMGRGCGNPGHTVVIHRSSDGVPSVFCPQSKQLMQGREHIYDYFMHQQYTGVHFTTKRSPVRPTHYSLREKSTCSGRARKKVHAENDRRVRPDAPSPRTGSASPSSAARDRAEPPDDTKAPSTVVGVLKGPEPRVERDYVLDLKRRLYFSLFTNPLTRGTRVEHAQRENGGDRDNLYAFLSLSWPGAAFTEPGREPRDFCRFIEGREGVRHWPRVLYDHRWSAHEGWVTGRGRLRFEAVAAFMASSPPFRRNKRQARPGLPLPGGPPRARAGRLRRHGRREALPHGGRRQTPARRGVDCLRRHRRIPAAVRRPRNVSRGHFRSRDGRVN